MNGDRTSGPLDILAIIDHLNGVTQPPLGDWSADVDHSGEHNSQDVLRVVDLLNGAGDFVIWNGVTLPTDDCEGPIVPVSAPDLSCMGCEAYDEWVDSNYDEPERSEIKEEYEVECTTAPALEDIGGRYIKLTTPETTDVSVAFIVVGGCSGGDVSCVYKYVQEDGTLGDTPVFKRPRTGSDPWGEIVYVHDAEILPKSAGGSAPKYVVQTYFEQKVRGSEVVETWLWADANGDDQVGLADALGVLDAFAGTFANGVTFQSADLVPCDPSPGYERINLLDVLAVLDAFAGQTYAELCADHLPCEEEMGGGGGGMGAPESATSATLGLTVWPTTIDPEDTFTVEVSAVGSGYVRGYQVGIQVSGGTTGSLDLESIEIDEERIGYLFYGESAVTMTDAAGLRILGAQIEDGSALSIFTRYLGTYVFKASSNASGTFSISIKASESIMTDPDGGDVDITLPSPKQVTVD